MKISNILAIIGLLAITIKALTQKELSELDRLDRLDRQDRQDKLDIWNLIKSDTNIDTILDTTPALTLDEEIEDFL